MSFLRTRRQKILAAGGTIAGLIAVVAAVAYFTTTGSGTGSASVGTSTALTVTQTGSVSNLTPGSAAQPVAYSISNPSGKGNQNLGKVSITGVTVTPTTGNTCTSSNFQVTTAGSAIGTINDGATYNSITATQPTVQMIDTGLNQDGCQGASLSFTLSAAQGS